MPLELSTILASVPGQAAFGRDDVWLLAARQRAGCRTAA
jgi:hypothetical protein